MSDVMGRAMGLAGEYERLVAMGDTARAGEASRTIDELVGQWVDGVWSLPACIVDRMRRRDVVGTRPGMVPAAEVQS